MNLRSLNLRGNKATITDDSFNCLLRHCRNLRSLDLSELEIESLPKFNHISTVIESDRLTFPNVAWQLKSLATSLTEIKLCSTPIGFDELETIATIPNLHLTNIDLDNCKNIDSITIRMILEAQNPSLSKISLLNTVPISIGSLMNWICPMTAHWHTIRLRVHGQRAMLNADWSISHLHLEYCSVDDKFVSVLNELKSIRKLNLRVCNFSEVQQSCFAIDRLRELDLSMSYGFTGDDFFRSIFAMTRLEQLSLDSVRIGDSTIADGGGLSGLGELRTLSLTGCGNVTGGVLGGLLRGLTRVRVLRVQGVRDIDDGFLRRIGSLARTVEEIDLSWASVTDGGLVGFLSRAFRLRKLRMDNCCNVTEKLVACLPEVCPYLQDVSMRNCDHVEYPITLNYYDCVFLHEWESAHVDAGR